MINIEFECTAGHRFTGTFKDYTSFKNQDSRKMIRCPACDNPDIKRIYTGCSILKKTHSPENGNGNGLTLYEQLARFNSFIKENFIYIENGFSDRARAIHYGIEEEKNIYGRATLEEIRELSEEGITIFPVINPENKYN